MQQFALPDAVLLQLRDDLRAVRAQVVCLEELACRTADRLGRRPPVERFGGRIPRRHAERGIDSDGSIWEMVEQIGRASCPIDEGAERELVSDMSVIQAPRLQGSGEGAIGASVLPHGNTAADNCAPL